MRKTHQTRLSAPTGKRQVSDGNAAAPEALIQVLWRRRRIVLAAMGLGAVLSIGYLAQAPKQYTATSKVYVETGAPKLVSDASAARPSENYLNTQCELIRSTPILSLALGSLESQNLRTLADVNDRFLFLKKRLQTSPGTKDDLIYVSFEGPDAVESSILVNSIVNAYITYQKTHRKSTATEVLTILRAEMTKRDAELADKSQRLLELKRQTGVILGSGDRGGPLMQRLNALSEALTQASLQTIDAQTRYEQAMLSLANDPARLRQVQQADAAIISETQEEMARSELFAQQQRLIDLRRQYMPEHPSIQTVQARIDQLHISLVVAARQRWMAAKQREENLRRNVEEQQKLALSQSVHVAEYQRLESEINRLERLNEVLDARIKELSLTENSGALDINVLEQAVPPPDASSPVPVRVLALGLVAGLLAGIGGAFLRDWTDRRLRSADEVNAALGMPILSVVPRMPPALSAPMKGLRVHQDPTSDAAEAYRSLRTAVYFGAGDGQTRTLLVTSPSAGDGKSTVAANLAIAMAQAGQRVLLVDADLRRPALHHLFAVPGDCGVANAMRDPAELRAAIVATSVPGLHLLPCGPRPGNPSEILNSQRFSDAIGDLAAEFDQVVLDSPPVMAVSDARILGAACDATLLVINAERSDRKLAVMARDGLLSVGANVLGVVVNDVSGTDGAFPRYYGYESSPAGAIAPAGGRLGALKVAGAPRVL